MDNRVMLSLPDYTPILLLEAVRPVMGPTQYAMPPASVDLHIFQTLNVQLIPCSFFKIVHY